MEVINHIWALEKVNSRPLSVFKFTMPPSSGSALLRNQKAIHDVYLASSEAGAVKRLRDVLLDQKIGADSLVTALETLPKLWTTTSASQQILVQLCGFYIDVCLKTGHVEAQIVAIQNLSEVMGQLILQHNVDTLPPGSLVELWTALPSRPMNPALSNAVIAASGGIVAALGQSREAASMDLASWGRIMADAGLEDKVHRSPCDKVRLVRSHTDSR